MLDYPALAAVAAVIREGSFERAAAMLGITPSAVSQRVRGLEEKHGTILVVRGQPCEATPLGRKLCDHLERVRLLEHDLSPGLELGIGAWPTLPVAVNADSLATWFPAAAAAFSNQANVCLDLLIDDESRTTARLRSGEVLAAVTSDSAPVQGCQTMAIGALRYAACASPDFVRQHFRDGVSPTRIEEAPTLRFDRRDLLQLRWAREAHGALVTGPVHWVPSAQGFLDMALHGLGWGMQPLVLAEPYLRSGRLVELSPGLRIDTLIYWTIARLHASSLKRLTDAVRNAAAGPSHPNVLLA